jgi:nucleoside-diphosphate-sugar epimerase
MKILVTGGAGFIGSHTVDLLINRGINVRVFDNFITGSLNNLPTQFLNDGLEIFRGSINDIPSIERAIDGCDAVLHLAALVSVPQSLSQPTTTYHINTTGTINVLEAAYREGVKRVVIASTCAVYGDLPGKKAESTPTAPLVPYASSKLMAEEAAQIYARCYDLEVVRLRYFNVYGARQQADSPYSGVIARWCDRVSAGEPCMIYGDGEQTRDFVAVEDVARANHLALTIPFDRFDLPPQQVSPLLNVATGTSVSLDRILDTLARITNTEIDRQYQPERSGDIRHSSANSDLLKQLGWQPRITLDRGLRSILSNDPIRSIVSRPA